MNYATKVDPRVFSAVLRQEVFSRKSKWIKACGVMLLWAATAIALPAQTFTQLHSFDGHDGNAPQTGALVQGTDDNLYGTTERGGAANDGTVYAVTTGGSLTTVINFNGTDGANPFSGVVQSAYGGLYGTTNFDGGNSLGTVFKINGQTPAVLHSFASSDGSPAQGGIIQGSDGNFYGTTLDDGANGSGTVFKITGSGAFTVLHSFTRTDPEGGNPYAPLVQASNGKSYGTTWDGGSFDHGTIYEINSSGSFSTVYVFCLANPNNCTDGYNPEGALVEGSDGNLYGMTARGGDPACDLNGYVGCGTIFKITPGGTLTTIHNFEGTDGAGPVSALIQGTDGNFYGTTQWDGANLTCPQGCGTVFSVTPSGTLTTLYNFCSVTGCTDGAAPISTLLQDTNGTFYGGTALGGTDGDGTIYSVSVGLGPFVKTNPTAGGVGRSINILGTDLTRATSVTFNGVPATFAVASASYITATVPAGATTGAVQVATPSGTLTSNVAFQALP
jgi:uncharacterized repeat protein (TIGR03803 family)